MYKKNAVEISSYDSVSVIKRIMTCKKTRAKNCWEETKLETTYKI